VNTYEFDGPMRYAYKPGQPVYFPNTENSRRPTCSRAIPGDRRRLRPHGVHAAGEDDDFSQPNALVNKVMDADARARLAVTIASTLGTVRPDIRERVFDYWRSVDKVLGDTVAELTLGVGVEPHGPAPANDDPDTPVNRG